jgi:hypothetical protein
MEKLFFQLLMRSVPPWEKTICMCLSLSCRCWEKKGGKRSRRVTQCLMNTAESPAGDGRQADGHPISFSFLLPVSHILPQHQNI